MATIREALEQREREMLALRFSGDRSQIEIAKVMGISQMQVSRLLSRVLSWLRAGMLGDRASVIFATPEEISGFIAREC